VKNRVVGQCKPPKQDKHAPHTIGAAPLFRFISPTVQIQSNGHPPRARRNRTFTFDEACPFPKPTSENTAGTAPAMMATPQPSRVFSPPMGEVFEASRPVGGRRGAVFQTRRQPLSRVYKNMPLSTRLGNTFGLAARFILCPFLRPGVHLLGPFTVQANDSPRSTWVQKLGPFFHERFSGVPHCCKGNRFNGT